MKRVVQDRSPRRGLKGKSMKARTKRSTFVEVRIGSIRHLGRLLFKTAEFIVLINNWVDGTDVGPLKTIRRRHVEPECDVTVLPRSPDMTVEFLRD
jgi:hypothetical protein